ncbi:membrane protein insertion efficiency factor YidD [Rhodoferax sp.]|uniref:membrane protein insertion efficiency factor YidD n=1 Tax=Rhodoferax sp. TaxID=50421 RepID=UPI00260F734E|nr:membrane protein insertion efficiency factor YidD [Rhodoferax sp.]MDD2809499.1 membrane protein insertion efficiency factor YidD [Rhodoferax sp.]MDD4945139.1 membrane protein insertion efficiency factor YidD [Rhodoferax sp.]
MMKAILMGVVKAYRLLLSPWLGSSCRFEPTCSVYALQALDRFGAAKGSYLTLARIGRCHPWCQGGLDPVPEHGTSVTPRLFSRLISSSTQKKSS